MLSGQRFELSAPTSAIETVMGEHVLLTVPAGEIVEVVCSPSVNDRAVQVLWNSRTVAMFESDLLRHAVKVTKTYVV